MAITSVPVRVNEYLRPSKLIKSIPRDGGGQLGFKLPEKKKLDICHGCGFNHCQRMTYEAKNGKRGKFICAHAGFYQGRAQAYYGDGEEDWSEVPFHASRLANEYGLDTSALDPMLMWLSRCYRKAGILT